MNRRVVIYGAGGIGGGIGALLAQAGHEVALIARGAHLEAIRRDGLVVKTPEWTEAVHLDACGHPGELELTGDEIFLFTMKSQDTVAALDALRAVAGSSPPVVMAQNGVANEREARRRFGAVYAMLVYMPAQFLEPGTIVLHGTPKRGTLHAGCYPEGVDATIEDLCAALGGAGFVSEPTPRAMRLKYGKLLMNLGNAVQALVGIDVDVSSLTRELRWEGRQCLDAAGIDFLPPRQLVELCRDGYDLGEVDGSPRLGGSSWQGAVRGVRSTEADHLNGEIVLLGAEHGVPTPFNAAVQRLAQAAVTEGRPPGATTLADIRREAEAGTC